MPKGRRNPKGARKGGGGGSNPGEKASAANSEDGYDTADNVSVVSGTSDGFSVAGDGVEADGEVDETSAQEDFEDKLKDCIDGLTQKSAKGRLDCLRGLQAALSKKILYDFVMDRKMTISDAVEKCLRKGRGDEQACAATCGVLLCIQLGDGDESSTIFQEFCPILTTIMTDASAAPKARGACAVGLGMMAFLASGEIGKARDVMKSLESLFRASYFKGDKTPPSHPPEVTAMHSSALTAWALLLSIMPTTQVREIVDSRLSKLSEILESNDVELRITCGETLALMYELAREVDEEFEGDDIEELCEILKTLATDSQKYRAKKDRRQQRSSFRDVLRAVEEGDVPSVQVKFGLEALRLDSWARKRQYEAFCQVLSSGMNNHLQENEFVRAVFGLGAVLPTGLPVTKGNKLERHLYNAAAFKARTKQRSKFRDKRSVTVMAD